MTRQDTLDALLHMALWNHVFLTAGDEDALLRRIDALRAEGARFRDERHAPAA